MVATCKIKDIKSFIGAALAERKRHIDLSKDGYIQIPIRIDDVQRWWSSNDFIGLYVEAFYKGENLALHSQHDSKNLVYTNKNFRSYFSLQQVFIDR
ncbi:unnamed protein product [Onchocerca flexuosa]|uniref:DUF4365 domain-containing protein n=1 Tax=Onchocerca flexuosa TaxID=387005 RepID=A0A183HT24_9BILA|nr:unnamed protein product [Onchocerca flexuosa]